MPWWEKFSGKKKRNYFSRSTFPSYQGGMFSPESTNSPNSLNWAPLKKNECPKRSKFTFSQLIQNGQNPYLSAKLFLKKCLAKCKPGGVRVDIFFGDCMAHVCCDHSKHTVCTSYTEALSCLRTYMRVKSSEKKCLIHAQISVNKKRRKSKSVKTKAWTLPLPPMCVLWFHVAC